MELSKVAPTSLPYVTLDRDWLDFSTDDTGELALGFSRGVWQSELSLVVDIYSAKNPVHPAGHVGWWSWSLWDKSDLVTTIKRRAGGFEAEIDGLEPTNQWQNPDFTGIDEDALAVRVVLRDVTTEAIVFEDALLLHNRADSLEAAGASRQLIHQPDTPITSAAWYGWPGDTAIHVVAANIFSRDAVGNFAIDLHRLFRANGIESQLYAAHFDPAVRGAIRHVSSLPETVRDHDLVVLNFSIYDPYVEMISQLRCRKILYFHNVTPPRFFQIYDAELAEFCSRAFAQLATLPRFDGYLANSLHSMRLLAQCLNSPSSVGAAIAEANADGEADGGSDESPVRDVVVCPPLVSSDRWAGIDAAPIKLPKQTNRLLYVGRIAPHKRVEDLMALFSQYARWDNNSALIIVGGCGLHGYANYLEYLLKNTYADVADRIHMLDHISDGQLKTVYESSSAFVTMTEHEGFCVPLIEAMHFGLPIFAYAEDGVSQTLGRSGRQYFTKDFESMAADMNRVLSTAWMRESLVTRQRARLARWRRESDGTVLWSAIERVIANGVGGR
ncbi:MAG: glycosyltransferase [Pirellulales bacterium]